MSTAVGSVETQTIYIILQFLLLPLATKNISPILRAPPRDGTKSQHPHCLAFGVHMDIWPRFYDHIRVKAELLCRIC